MWRCSPDWASAPRRQCSFPGLGAIVRLRENLPTAREDARVGLAGPIWGLGAAVAAYALSLAFDSQMMLAICNRRRVDQSIQPHARLATRWLPRISRAHAAPAVDRRGGHRGRAVRILSRHSVGRSLIRRDAGLRKRSCPGTGQRRAGRICLPDRHSHHPRLAPSDKSQPPRNMIIVILISSFHRLFMKLPPRILVALLCIARSPPSRPRDRSKGRRRGPGGRANDQNQGRQSANGPGAAREHHHRWRHGGFGDAHARAKDAISKSPPRSPRR